MVLESHPDGNKQAYEEYKKYMVVSALMAVSFHTCAMAEGGTITYTGMITSQTCTINDGSPDFSVKLPTIAVETLMKSGETSGRTPFRIRLSNCDEDLEGVASSLSLAPIPHIRTIA